MRAYWALLLIVSSAGAIVPRPWTPMPAVNFAGTLMGVENMARIKQSHLMDGGEMTEMPLTLWRAELRAQRWGLAPEYWMYPSPEQLPMPQVMSYAWLHDVGVRALDNSGMAAILPSWQAFDRIHFTRAQFTGYWALPPEVVEPSALKASLYRDGQQVLVVVSNLSADAQQATLQVAKLLPGATQAADAMTNEQFSLTGKVASLSVPARDFRLILLRGRQ